MEVPYVEIVLGFTLLLYIFETYLDIRQHLALKSLTLPTPLVGIVSQHKFERSRAHSLDKSCFHFVHEAFTVTTDLAILYFGALPWCWEKSKEILVFWDLNSDNEMLHTMGFMFILVIWSQIIELPFSLYSTFVIEASHGFNNHTIGSLFRDALKVTCLSVVIGPPAVAAIILIVQNGGPYLAIYLWGVSVVLSLLMLTLYPILIAPLFNDFTPLPAGELTVKIERLASSLEFPLKELFVVDGSTKSTHRNAYMYGFFNKGIVLYDTLLQQCKNKEVVAVIVHELGHWKRNHTMYSFIAIQVFTCLQFLGWGFVTNSEDFFRRFGFETQPVLIGLILFQNMASPPRHLLSFLLNLMSRGFEFQADRFAKELGFGSALRAALVKLPVENLSEMNIDRWYSAYHHSHPPLVERLQALDVLDKKAE